MSEFYFRNHENIIYMNDRHGIELHAFIQYNVKQCHQGEIPFIFPKPKEELSSYDFKLLLMKKLSVALMLYYSIIFFFRSFSFHLCAHFHSKKTNKEIIKELKLKTNKSNTKFALKSNVK